MRGETKACHLSSRNFYFLRGSAALCNLIVAPCTLYDTTDRLEARQAQ